LSKNLIHNLISFPKSKFIDSMNVPETYELFELPPGKQK